MNNFFISWLKIYGGFEMVYSPFNEDQDLFFLPLKVHQIGFNRSQELIALIQDSCLLFEGNINNTEFFFARSTQPTIDVLFHKL